MTQLLVSVRSAAEAEAALAGGAALIDVKEPARGSLGRASDQTIAEVVQAVAGRLPVSAALGELWDDFGEELPAATADLSFVKWGLADCFDGGETSWWWNLAEEADRLGSLYPFCRMVAVAYADWQRARAPRPEEVCAFASWQPTGAFLLDTWGKDGSTLLDWMSPAEVTGLCQRCRDAGIRVALAGSLGHREIRALRSAAPDWFAVRGAVCQEGERDAAVETGKVRRLVELLCEEVTYAIRRG
jgi:uncharacterized protein (UPF0264 family)